MRICNFTKLTPEIENRIRLAFVQNNKLSHMIINVKQSEHLPETCCATPYMLNFSSDPDNKIFISASCRHFENDHEVRHRYHCFKI